MCCIILVDFDDDSDVIPDYIDGKITVLIESRSTITLPSEHVSKVNPSIIQWWKEVSLIAHLLLNV